MWAQPHPPLLLCSCTIVSRKRAHGRYTLVCAQTRRWVDICNRTAFYHEKAPMFSLSQRSRGYYTILHTSGVAKQGHTGAHALATRGGATSVQVSMRIISVLLIANRVLNSLETYRHSNPQNWCSSPLAQAGIDARVPFFSHRELY